MTHNKSAPSAEKQFGAQVRDARDARGWSQEALARHLKETLEIDLHQSAIARLERGERAIRLNEAAALAQMLGLDLQTFSGIVPKLTKKEYEKAKKEYEQVIEREEEIARQLRSTRDELESRVAKLALDRRHWSVERWRYDAMIREYEARGEQTDG